MINSKQCPYCKKDVPGLLSLDLTTSEEKSLSEVRAGEAINYLRAQNDILRAEFEEAQRRCAQEKKNSDTWMEKAKQNEKFANDNRELWQEAKRKLKNYSEIHLLLGGINSTVEAELPKYPPTPDSIKSLAEMIFVLQAERRRLTQEYNGLEARKTRYKADNQKLKEQYDQKVDELKKLRRMYEMQCAKWLSLDISPLPAVPRGGRDHAAPSGSNNPMAPPQRGGQAQPMPHSSLAPHKLPFQPGQRSSRAQSQQQQAK